MNREKDLNSKLDDWYSEMIKKYLECMTIPSSFSSVKSIELVNKMTNTINTFGINGFVFLQEKQENEKMYIRGAKELYKIEDIKDIKDELLEIQRQEGHTGNGIIKLFHGQYYYFKRYSYTNYNIGFGIDLGKKYREWISSDNIQGYQLLITDDKANILMNSDGKVQELTSQEADEYMRREKNTRLISEYHISDRIKLYLYEDGRKIVPIAYMFLQGLAWFSFLILFILWKVITRQVVYPLKFLQDGMQKLEGHDLNYQIEEQAKSDDFEYIYAEFNKMADDILKSHEKDMLLYQIQLDNLKLQVNPHMLLNSFTMIYSLAETKQYEIIQKFTLNLVNYFRYCLKENSTMVSLKSEMDFIENYIEIQKMRFPGEIASVYTMETGLETALIPPFLIQNFVENAAKYARIPEQTVEILISTRREGEHLMISIIDTGKGIDEHILDYLNRGELYIDKSGVKHIGIWNCRRRMEGFYGADTLLKITSIKGEGTQVWIEVPYREAGKSNEFIDC